MGAYGSGAYGAGAYGIGGVAATTPDAARALWQAAVNAKTEVNPAGDPPRVFHTSEPVVDGSIGRVDQPQLDIGDRVSGGYIVATEPGVINSLRQMSVFTEVP